MEEFVAPALFRWFSCSGRYEDEAGTPSALNSRLDSGLDEASPFLVPQPEVGSAYQNAPLAL